MGLLDKIKNIFTEDNEPVTVHPGRNEPCWCGSGKKYKKCHLEDDARKSAKAQANCNTC